MNLENIRDRLLVNNINTSIDSIYLYQSFRRNTYNYNSICSRQKTQLNNYICEVIGGKDTDTIRYKVRVKPFEVSFLVIEFTPYERYIPTKIDIHLNNFLYQRFRRENFIEGETIKKELERIISHYTFLGNYDLDRMTVSKIDIATDIILDHNPGYYKYLIKNFPFSHKIIHENYGRGTISIHKASDVATIDLEEEDTVRKASIYNKYVHLFDVHDIELPRHTIRFEYKYWKRDKNKGIKLNGGRVGVKKFSHIFKADITTANMEKFFDGWLESFIDLDLKEELEKIKNSNRRKNYLEKFSGQVDYYKKRENLDAQLAIIDRKIDMAKEKWIDKQFDSMHPEVKDKLWKKLKELFREKLKSYFSVKKYGEEELISQLQRVYNDNSLNIFLKESFEYRDPDIYEIAFEKELRKKIRFSLRVIFNSLFENYKTMLRNETTNKIRNLNTHYDKYRQDRYVMLATQQVPYTNKRFRDLHLELLSKVGAMQEAENKSSKLMNTYKVYQEVIPEPLQYEVV